MFISSLLFFAEKENVSYLSMQSFVIYFKLVYYPSILFFCAFCGRTAGGRERLSFVWRQRFPSNSQARACLNEPSSRADALRLKRADWIVAYKIKAH